MKPIKFYLILIVILHTLGCDRRNSKEDYKNEDRRISKIIIQSFPVFYTNSLLICDLKNSEILFTQIGEEKSIKINGAYKVKPTSIRLSDTELGFIKDSILQKFKPIDFEDSILDIDDGIGTIMIIIYSDESNKSIELINNGTNKQIELITNMLDLVKSYCTDSLTNAYIERLKNHYE